MADMVDLAERRRRIAEISADLTDEDIKRLFPAGGIVNPNEGSDNEVSVMRRRIRAAKAMTRASQRRKGGLSGSEGY